MQPLPASLKDKALALLNSVLEQAELALDDDDAAAAGTSSKPPAHTVVICDMRTLPPVMASMICTSGNC